MRQTAWFSVAAPESPAEIILEIGKLDEIVDARLPQHQFALVCCFRAKGRQT